MLGVNLDADSPGKDVDLSPVTALLTRSRKSRVNS